MFNIFRVFVLFLSFSVYGGETEDIYSIYFSSKATPNTKKLVAIDSKYYQHYSLIAKSENDLRVAAGDELIVDETGVYIEKNKLLGISREEIRENPTYSIREGYLFGVVKNDSVLVALDGETYYFLLAQKSYLYQIAQTKTKLYQGLSSNEYLILSQEENGYFSALYISFTAGKISLNELNLDQKEFDYRTVKNQNITTDKIPTYILNPSKADWKKIMTHFIMYDSYAIVKG